MVWTINRQGYLHKTISSVKFAQRNPRYSAYYLKNRRMIRDTIRSYKKTGYVNPESIRIVAIKLTTSCDLRCSMCFQWREQGLHSKVSKSKIDIKQADSLFAFAGNVCRNFVLKGGEPLVHPDFSDFVDGICSRGSIVNLCTNGTQIHRHMDVLLEHHSQTTFLISVDGLEETHESIRGAGSYQKTISNLKTICERKKRDKLRWVIGIEVTLQPENLNEVQAIIHTMEKIGVDWIVFNHLWVVPIPARYELKEKILKYTLRPPKTLDGFDIPFNDEKVVNRFVEAAEKIKNSKSSVPVFVSPNFSAKEANLYYKGDLPPPESYLKFGVKIDIDSNGDIVPSTMFPEFSLGSIYSSSIEEILQGKLYQSVAEDLRKNAWKVFQADPDSYNFSL